MGEMRLAAKKAFDEFAADPISETLVVQRIAEGETLVDICRSLELPYALVAQWIVEDAERVRQYDAALMLWADALAQETLAIANTTKLGVIRKLKSDGSEETTEEDMLGHRKLQIETRMKLAGKWDRKRYGEHTKVEHSGMVTSLIQVLASLPSPHERDVTPPPGLLIEQPAAAIPAAPLTTHDEI